MNHSFKRPVLPPKCSLATLSKGHKQQIIKDISELQKPHTCQEDNNSESILVNHYLNQHDGLNANRARQETVVDTEELEELNYLANKSVFLFGFSGETLESLILGKFSKTYLCFYRRSISVYNYNMLRGSEDIQYI